MEQINYTLNDLATEAVKAEVDQMYYEMMASLLGDHEMQLLTTGYYDADAAFYGEVV